MMTMDFGWDDSDIASVLVMTRVRSIVTPGSDRGLAPVAMMTWSARRVSAAVPPARTSTIPGPASRPFPGMRSIPFFFIRYSTPLTILSDTPLLRLMILPKSTCRFSYVIPHSSPLRKA